MPFYLTFENQEQAITGLSFIETSFHTSFIKSQSQYFSQTNLLEELYCWLHWCKTFVTVLSVVIKKKSYCIKTQTKLTSTRLESKSYSCYGYTDKFNISSFLLHKTNKKKNKMNLKMPNRPIIYMFSNIHCLKYRIFT